MTLAIFVFLASLSAYGGRSDALRLDAATVDKMVLERNDHVRAARQTVESHRARTGYLRRSFLPKVQARAGTEYFQTGVTSALMEPFVDLSAEINLFRSGRDLLESEIRESNLVITSSEAKGLVQDELSKARQKYWALIYQRELSGLIEDAIVRNMEALTSAKRRYNAGLGSGTDRMDFEVYRTNLEQDLARVRLEERNTRRELNVLLGIDAIMEIVTPDQPGHEHEDKLAEFEFNPAIHRDIQSLEARRDSARLIASRERRWWTPSLDIFGGQYLFTFRERDYSSLQDRFDTVIGARLSVDLFDGGTALSEARAAEMEAEALDSRIAQGKRELRASVQSALDELRLIHDLVHGAEKNVIQARSYLTATLSEYKRGQKNSPDVFSANQRYLDTQRRLAEMKRDYQLTRAQIQNVLGQ